jgi:phosphatidylserine decarboxylase
MPFVCGLLAFVWLCTLNFYRCPIRYFNGDTEKLVVAPADGKIVVIEEVDEHVYFHDKRLMISIFMSPLNVHANWFPVDGKVKFVKHFNGNYHKAWLPKASEENEHADIMIETPDGQDILVRQIAGAVARRIVTYAKEGEECYIDEHLGFIKLGSRVDVYLPLTARACVTMDQPTTGDQTVIAKLS